MVPTETRFMVCSQITTVTPPRTKLPEKRQIFIPKAKNYNIIFLMLKIHGLSCFDSPSNSSDSPMCRDRALLDFGADSCIGGSRHDPYLLEHSQFSIHFFSVPSFLNLLTLPQRKLSYKGNTQKLTRVHRSDTLPFELSASASTKSTPSPIQWASRSPTS